MPGAQIIVAVISVCRVLSWIIRRS